MNYQETLDYLYNKLPIYQRTGIAAYKSNIDNITQLAKQLGNPHVKFKSIHIAGTNGKGSTAHLVASVLQEAGYKVGLYTSPHLKDFRERIRINGKTIPKKTVVNFINKNKDTFNHLQISFFEMSVSMAFDFFAKKKVDIAIIETGLGGRLDSTNIINPELSIITNISLDHTLLLGNSIKKIAKEKAGIIKKETCVIIGKKQKQTTPIFNKKAKEKKAKLLFAKKQLKRYKSDLKGDYQKENIDTCISAIHQLKKQGWKIQEKNITLGIKNCVSNTKILGRWQILNKKPLTICDTAHNEAGIKQIMKQISEIKYTTLHFVLGTVNDKKNDKILCLLDKEAIYYFCKPNIPRGLDEIKLKKESEKFHLNGKCYSSVKLALEAANINAKKQDLIFIGGSTFVVAEII